MKPIYKPNSAASDYYIKDSLRAEMEKEEQ